MPPHAMLNLLLGIGYRVNNREYTDKLIEDDFKYFCELFLNKPELNIVQCPQMRLDSTDKLIHNIPIAQSIFKAAIN